MCPIRIHLGQMPPMLRTMINDLLEAEPDMAVVGNSYAGDDALLAASTAKADMLISQEQTSLGDNCLSAIITENPAAILAISSSGEGGTSVNLIRRPISLDTGGGSGLADTVRDILGHQ
jgi:chemotaxis response regulator CheB